MMNSALTARQIADSILELENFARELNRESSSNALKVLRAIDGLRELQERRKADNDEPLGFVTKRCAEHMHDDDSDENNWMWSISAVVIGCNPELKHEVPVYLHPASSGKEGA